MNHVLFAQMNIALTRIIFILIAAWIFVVGYNYLLLYEMVIWMAVEFFTWWANPAQEKDVKLFRLISVCYMLFIGIDRMYKPAFSSSIATGVNILEHLVFGIVAMSMLLFLKRIYIPDLKRIFVLWGLFLACNGLGLVNELYQNLIHRTMFDFTSDSMKDIIVNFVASVLFVGVYVLKTRKASDR